MRDERNPAENLLSSAANGQKRWLSSPEDRSGRSEIEFMLQPTKIGFVDIGNYGSAIVEVLVGRSSWPQNKEYVTLLPAVTMMTQADSKILKNRTSVRMFSAEHLDVAARREKWDRIRIVCFQPYRKDVPFGLSFLRFRTPADDDLILEAHPQPEMKDTLFSTNSPISPKTNVSFLTNQRHLSRSAQMVLAASTSPHIKRSPKLKSKSTLSFEDEVNDFLISLDLHLYDLENTSVRTIRHKLEIKKGRKLSQEEKVLFIKLTRDFVDNLELHKLSENPSKASPSSKNSIFRTRNILALEDARPENQKLEKDQNISCSEVDSSNQGNSKQSSYVEDLSDEWIQPSRRNGNSVKTSKIKAKLNIASSNTKDLSCSYHQSSSSNDFVNLSPSMEEYDLPSSSISSSSSKDTEFLDIKFHIPEDIEEFIKPSSAMEAFSECPICSDLISSQMIEQHVDLCLERKETNCQSTLSSEDSSQENSSGNSNQQNPESWIECPVCGSLFEEWCIETHASQCVEDISY